MIVRVGLPNNPNDVTHNANFERVILIYVTDITCRCQIIAQATLVCRMDMFHSDYCEKGKWDNKKILFL